jgi:hypothetical protein
MFTPHFPTLQKVFLSLTVMAIAYVIATHHHPYVAATLCIMTVIAMAMLRKPKPHKYHLFE